MPNGGAMFHVDSEVGRLRQVILHRPDLELKRLTPDNAADLLFDDVLWVSRAQAEHDAFAEVLRSRGVARALLRRPARPDPGDHRGPRLHPGPGVRPALHGPLAAATLRAGDGRARPGEPGAVPGRRDHQAGDRRTRPRAEEHRLPLAGPRRLRARPAAEPALPARHLVLDLRRRVGQRDAPGRPGSGRPSPTRPSTAGTRCSPRPVSRSGTTARTPRRPPSRAATSWCSATGRCWSG